MNSFLAGVKRRGAEMRRRKEEEGGIITKSDMINALAEWRLTLIDSYKDRIGRNKGIVSNPKIRHEIRCIEAVIKLIQRHEV